MLGDNLLVPTFWHAGGDILDYQGTSQLAELTEGVTAISIITLALKQKIKGGFLLFPVCNSGRNQKSSCVYTRAIKKIKYLF